MLSHACWLSRPVRITGLSVALCAMAAEAARANLDEEPCHGEKLTLAQMQDPNFLTSHLKEVRPGGGDPVCITVPNGVTPKKLYCRAFDEESKAGFGWKPAEGPVNREYTPYAEWCAYKPHDTQNACVALGWIDFKSLYDIPAGPGRLKQICWNMHNNSGDRTRWFTLYAR